MNTWLYSGAGKLWALTRDHDGANLPDHLGPWEWVRFVILHGEDNDERDAIALIEEHGFCCFKKGPDEL